MALTHQRNIPISLGRNVAAFIILLLYWIYIKTQYKKKSGISKKFKKIPCVHAYTWIHGCGVCFSPKARILAQIFDLWPVEQVSDGTLIVPLSFQTGLKTEDGGFRCGHQRTPDCTHRLSELPHRTTSASRSAGGAAVLADGAHAHVDPIWQNLRHHPPHLRAGLL